MHQNWSCDGVDVSIVMTSLSFARPLSHRAGRRPAAPVLSLLAKRGPMAWQIFETSRRSGGCSEPQARGNARGRMTRSTSMTRTLARARRRGSEPVYGLYPCRPTKSSAAGWGSSNHRPLASSYSSSSNGLRAANCQRSSIRSGWRVEGCGSGRDSWGLMRLCGRE